MRINVVHQRWITLCRSAIVGTMVAVGMFVASCERWVDTNVNVDPNNPTDVPVNLLLSSAEGGIAYVQTSTLSRVSNLLSQHYMGTDRQHEAYYNYQLTEFDIGDIWDISYSNVMVNLNTIITKSNAAGARSPHYRGAARVLLAMNIGAVTDAWGDAPFSQAFRGVGSLQPTFDTQQAIYQRIQQLLDSAIVDFAAPSSIPSLDLGDVIFAGDVTEWTRTAWTLKAKYAIHLTKREGNTAATNALNFLRNGMASNDDNMIFQFSSAETSSSPLYQFLQGRTGDIGFGATLASMMNRLNDPRRAVYGRPAANGTLAGGGDFGAYFFAINGRAALITYAEDAFIEAEANVRLNNMAAARTAFINAVTASLQQYGVSATAITAYLAQASVVPATGITLERIMEQKYIHLFTNPESWTDWRRTGFPALTAIAGANIPRRLPLPINERLYNLPNYPTGGNTTAWMFGRMWWDQ
jgi:hypothetical protein